VAVGFDSLICQKEEEHILFMFTVCSALDIVYCLFSPGHDNKLHSNFGGKYINRASNRKFCRKAELVE